MARVHKMLNRGRLGRCLIANSPVQYQFYLIIIFNLKRISFTTIGAKKVRSMFSKTTQIMHLINSLIIISNNKFKLQFCDTSVLYL